MHLNSILYVLIGSVFGLTLRILLQSTCKTKLGFSINKTSLVNLLASFFLGIFLAFEFTNQNLLMLFYFGFLGSLSTFSSFVYQLFVLIKRKKFIRSFLYYLEIIIRSFIFFYLGFFLIQILSEWTKKTFYLSFLLLF